MRWAEAEWRFTTAGPDGGPTGAAGRRQTVVITGPPAPTVGTTLARATLGRHYLIYSNLAVIAVILRQNDSATLG